MGFKPILYTTYRLNAHLDLKDLNIGDADKEFAPLAGAMLSQTRMRFLLTLPVKAETSNASSTTDGGRTLQWDLLPGQDNELQAVARVANVGNIVAMVGGAVLALGALGFAVWRKRVRVNQPVSGGEPGSTA